MLSSTLVNLAFGAIAARAFVVPPGTVAPTVNDAAADAESVTQSITLPCAECVLSSSAVSNEENSVWAQGGATSVLLNFTLAEDRRSIAMNGYTLYPPSQTLEKPTVEQVPASASLVDIKEHAVEKSDYVTVSADSLFISEEIVTLEGAASIHVIYRIIDLDNRPVSLDDVRVTLLRTADGELELLNVERLASKTPKVVVDCGGLPLFVCKLKVAIAAKIEVAKLGCHGMMKRPHHNAVKVHSIDQNEEIKHAFNPNFHSFLRDSSLHSVVRAILMVLIPILAGFTIGMTVSVIGMLVGRLIALVWVKYVRGDKRGYASVAQDDNDDESNYGSSPIKRALGLDCDLDMSEPLPRYENAPAYEDVSPIEKQ